MLTDKADYRKHTDNTFALAIAVLRERISGLPKEDQNDLYALMPVLVSGDEEERDSALIAAVEILDQSPANARMMELLDGPGDEMKRWISFVSAKIREAREKAGLTQEELADAAQLPQSHISRLETGKHSPTSMTLEKIAHALNIPVSTFDPCAD